MTRKPKKPVHHVEMTEGKREIIRGLLEEYDIESAQDIQDALKDLLGGTIKEMMEAEMDEHIGYENLSGRMRMTLNVIIETDTRINGSIPAMATLTSIPFPATISRSKPTLYPAADLNPIHPKSDRHPDHITLVGQLSIYCQFYQKLLLQQSVLVQDLYSSCPIRYAFSRSLGKSFSCTNFFLLSSKLAIFSHSFKDRG